MRKLLVRLFLNEEIQEYIANNQLQWQNNVRAKNEEVVLVDFIDSAPVYNSYAYFSNYLSDTHGLKIKYFDFTDILTKKSFFPNRKLEKIYNSFNASYGFSMKEAKVNKKKARQKTIEVLKKIRTKSDVVNIKIDEITVGDLIYDTYLRNEKKSTLASLHGKDIAGYIYLAHLIFYTCMDYFEQNSVKRVITGDISYMYSGIIVRVACRFKVESLTFLEMLGLYPQTIDCHTYVRKLGYYNYHQDFLKFDKDSQKKYLEISQKAIESKLFLKDNSTTPYMTKNSFDSSGEKVMLESERPKVLVLLHCFFDSPHIYQNMLFPDFWEWINFVLTEALKTDNTWYVKPHPNGLSGNKKVVEELKKLYHDNDKIIFIDPSISNLDIVESGIKAVFTVYGTAGHEFAYLDIPVINAGDNPHIAYNFNIHPKNIDELQWYIANADKIDISIDKKDICEFFYMHYLNVTPFEQLSPIYVPSEFDTFIEEYSHDLNARAKRAIYQNSMETLVYFNKINNPVRKAEAFKYFQERGF